MNDILGRIREIERHSLKVLQLSRELLNDEQAMEDAAACLVGDFFVPARAFDTYDKEQLRMCAMRIRLHEGNTFPSLPQARITKILRSSRKQLPIREEVNQRILKILKNRYYYFKMHVRWRKEELAKKPQKNK